MESSQRENLNHLFCRNVSFLTGPHCQFRGVGQGRNMTYLYLLYLLFQAQWDRCYQQNQQTYNYILVREHHLYHMFYMSNLFIYDISDLFIYDISNLFIYCISNLFIYDMSNLFIYYISNLFIYISNLRIYYKSNLFIYYKSNLFIYDISKVFVYDMSSLIID